MKNNHREITIVDPLRWQIKIGERRKFYHQFHASRWSDSTYLALTNDSKVVFNWILSQVLMSNKVSVSICLESACGILSMRLDDFKGCLMELKVSDYIDLQTLMRKSAKTPIKVSKKVSKKEAKTELESVCDLWNTGAQKLGYSKIVIPLSSIRKSKLEKAMAAFPELEQWRLIFNSTLDEGFTGSDGRLWQPSFDWLFKKENYLRLYEKSQIKTITSKEQVESLMKEG